MLPVTFQQNKWCLLFQPIPPPKLDSWGRYTGRQKARGPQTHHGVHHTMVTSAVRAHIERKHHSDPNHSPSLKSQSQHSGWCVSNFWHGVLPNRPQWQQQVSVRVRACVRVCACGRESGCCLAQSWLLDVSAQPRLLLLLLLMPLLLSNMSLLFRAFHQRAATCKTRRVASALRRITG